ncbi:hydroxysteroid 11-beta-dehydrogenase 1-like protein [Moschus berezovskii]|uniref:hydroxysteroid 11-beta-dehydrogenase 1-like protein n=1 Tax=Moschus berezovskii TaxID=68408 RepID=UPI0024447583|nr:hydroxysteroid 11-beta-dehydrogenase 1-like protein [Moschus berezovskii]
MKVLLLTGLGALFFAYYWDDNFDPASLQGARVLLTGVSAGIGEELAYHYARLGSHLVLTAHTKALLQQVVGNCRKLGAPKVFYIAADMASPEVPERVVQFALDKLGGLDYLVLNHLGTAPAGTRVRSSQSTRWLMQSSSPAPTCQGFAPSRCGLGFLLRPVTRSRHLQVNFLSYVQLTSSALPSLADSKGSLVVVSSLLGQVPTSFSSPYSAAKFALDSFFSSLRRELDMQEVNVAITMCVLGLRDHASAAEGVRWGPGRKAGPGWPGKGCGRAAKPQLQSPSYPPVPRGITRVKAAPGPKAALAVIRGGATRTSGVFYPWRFHLLCLLRSWMPHSRAWFVRQELNITTPAAV